MADLTYPLYNGQTINRWTVAGVFEKKMRFEPVTMSGDINLWLKEGFSIHENPCKKEFIGSRRSSVPEPPALINILPGCKMEMSGQSIDWDIYFPFDNVNVEMSGFWTVPTYLRSYAVTYIRSECRHTAGFELITCGGATLWLNGELIIDFTPYTRNIEKSTFFEVELDEGINQLVVCFDDLAERDTQYYFRLDYKGEKKLETIIPVGDKNPEAIKSVESTLYHAYFPSDTVKEGDVRLNITFDLPAQEVKCVIGAASAESEDLESTRIIERVVGGKACGIDLGKVDDFGMGFNFFTVDVLIEGLKITRRLTLQIYPERPVPAASPAIAERKKEALAFLARYGENNIHKAVAIIYTGGDLKHAQRLIDRQIEGINDRGDCSDFYLVLLYRLWQDYRNSGAFPEDFWARIKECIMNFRYWMDEPGDDVMWFFSENHALLFHTCELLAGQLFPGEVFPNSGMTGKQHVKKAETLLNSWFERFFEEGFTEWNSSAYYPIDVLGLANLYAMAASPELKARAGKALDKVFYYTAINGYKGVLSCSAGRCYEKELKGNYVNGTSSMAWIAWGRGYLNQSSKAAVSFCLSDYLPPQEQKDCIDLGEHEGIIFRNTQGYKGHVDLYMYKTEDFLLSSACGFRPGSKGYQEQVIQATLGSEAIIWVNHPGELHTYGCGRPSFWAGNGCLPRVYQYKGLGMLIFNIHPSHTAAYTHAYMPVSCFDSFIQYGNWCFARKGKGYAAVYAHNGFYLQQTGANKGRELVSEGFRNFWILRLSNKDEFESFDMFTDAMLKAPFLIENEHSICLTDPVYGTAEITREKPLTINGKKVEYKGFSTDGLLERINLRENELAK